MSGYVLQRAYLLRRPAELADRALNKLEALREDPGHRRTHEQVRQDALTLGYRVADDWQPAVEQQIGPMNLDGFDAVWQSLRDELAAAGHGLDADERLAQTVWATVRNLRPGTMVETGVSRGILTRIALEAMERNEHGRLYSIDLPPHAIGVAQSATAVLPHLHHRWEYLLGTSRRRLRPLLRRLGTVDVFLHDSQHTERNMLFELRTAMPHVRRAVMSDDIHENRAWALAVGGGAIVQQKSKAGVFGLYAV